jgi:hypothetical protein
MNRPGPCPQLVFSSDLEATLTTVADIPRTVSAPPDFAGPSHEPGQGSCRQSARRFCMACRRRFRACRRRFRGERLSRDSAIMCIATPCLLHPPPGAPFHSSPQQCALSGSSEERFRVYRPAASALANSWSVTHAFSAIVSSYTIWATAARLRSAAAYDATQGLLASILVLSSCQAAVSSIAVLAALGLVPSCLSRAVSILLDRHFRQVLILKYLVLALKLLTLHFPSAEVAQVYGATQDPVEGPVGSDPSWVW